MCILFGCRTRGVAPAAPDNALETRNERNIFVEDDNKLDVFITVAAVPVENPIYAGCPPPSAIKRDAYVCTAGTKGDAFKTSFFFTYTVHIVLNAVTFSNRRCTCSPSTI